MTEYDPKQWTFAKPSDRLRAAGRRQIVRFAGTLVEMQSAPLKKLREEIVEADAATLNWVTTVSTLRALRKVDDSVAEGELHILASAVLAGAPVARACRDVWMSPAEFKARAHKTTAEHVMVRINPEAGA